ncbi:MAG TPA: hypothetical protein VM451_03450 [Candidatus Limnocylindria bacterium]|nr:hypothetical protein [Candidatus Limnocylindria bacterium]
MTTRADISSANWAALVEAAPAIARAVSASGGSTTHSEQELGAFIAFVGDASVQAGGESLLGQLVADVAGRLAGGVPAPDGDVYVDGLEKARKAGAILSVEADPDEATAVRAWLLGAARAVAAAAKDGGVLGVGAKTFSDWEKETIGSIADALGA